MCGRVDVSRPKCRTVRNRAGRQKVDVPTGVGQRTLGSWMGQNGDVKRRTDLGGSRK